MSNDYTIKGTKFTYKEWAEAAVNDHVYRAWDLAGRKTNDYDIVIVSMDASEDGFVALIRGMITDTNNMLFEVRYECSSEKTIVVIYHAVDIFVATSSQRVRR